MKNFYHELYKSSNLQKERILIKLVYLYHKLIISGSSKTVKIVFWNILSSSFTYKLEKEI